MTPEEIAAAVERELAVRRQVDAALQEEAKKKEKKGGLSEFWKHPAVLLVLGFMLTGVLGTGLTAWWQQQEWAGQQEYNAGIEATKERLATMNLATTEIATAFASVEDVLHLVTWEWPKQSKVVTLEERAKHWRDQSRRWRVAEKELRARIHANFEDATIAQTFDDITIDRERLGNYMQNLLLLRDQNRRSFGRKKKGEVDDVTDFQRLSERLVTDVTIGADATNIAPAQPGKLEKLSRLMLEEIERRRIPPRRSFWSRFTGAAKP